MEKPLISDDTIPLLIHPSEDEKSEKSVKNDGLQCPEVEGQQVENSQPRVLSIDSSHNRFNTIPKNISTPIFEHSINAVNQESTALKKPDHTLISIDDNSAVSLSPKSKTSSASSHRNLDIIPQNVLIEQSKSRLAVKFLLKKSKRFCGAIHLYLTKPLTTSSSKLKSIMFNIKDSLKNMLDMSGPNSKTIAQITNSFLSKLKGQRLPDCLRLLNYSLKPLVVRKRSKHENATILPLFNYRQADDCKTFLNPVKKPEIASLEGFQFVKPKVYECGYCETKFFKLPIYLKHIRRHVELIRCESCGKAFSSDINKRRHRLQCHKKAIL